MLKKMHTLILIVCICIACQACSNYSAKTGPVDTSPDSKQSDSSNNRLQDSEQTFSNEITEQLNNAMNQKPGAYVTAPARPSYIKNDKGEKTIMSIVDRDDVDHVNGLYVLTTSCIGNGHLMITFTVGEKTEKNQLDCESTIRSVITSLRIDNTVKGMIVRIDPQSIDAAEIAYRIDIS